MSNWSERERKIFKVQLGKSEKSYDPLRLILNYNRAVRDKGGPEVLKSIWEKYHAAPVKGEDITPEERLNRELQDAEGSLYLGELGIATFGEKSFPDEEGWTLGEGIESLYQFLSYITKKERGAESSPISDSPDLEQLGETKEESLSTPITSAAS